MKGKNEFTHKFNLTPRLSASQVAEYLSANATARRRIITDAKYPPHFLIARYDEVREVLCNHLAKKTPSEDVLTHALDVLGRKESSQGASDWTKTNCKINSEAIIAFQSQEKALDLGKLRYRVPNIGHQKLTIKGVAVSVSLDLMSTAENDNGKAHVGGVILCLWKTRSADIADRCAAMATLVSEVIRRVVKNDQRCDPKMCLAVDIFGGKVYRAKVRQKMFLKSVENSCSEVATIWPSVPPPPNYKGPLAKAS
jgi:hypothetical protein